MKKKKNNIAIWVVVILAVLILLKVDWSNPLASNQNQFVEKEKANTSLGGDLGGGDQTQPESKWLTLSITPSSVCLGNNVTGDVISNMPNTQCIIQYRFTSIMQWQTLNPFTLNSRGAFTQKAPANNVGSVTFRVICGSLVSNQQTVTVNNCYTCFDSDLGIDFVVSGNCQSNFDNIQYMDGCVGSETYMREYYCDGNGKCQWIPNTNWKCNQMGCEQLFHPLDQSSCNTGNCLTGTCTYIPAEAMTIARCECK